MNEFEPVSEAAESIVDEGEAAPVETPDEINSQDYVTPELEAKFKAVFEKDKPAAERGGKSAKRIKREASQEEADELDEAAGADTRSQRDKDLDADADLEDGIDNDDTLKTASAKKKPAAEADEQVADQEVDANATTLDPVLRNQAKRAGWTDVEIDNFYDANAELATKTFTRIHQSNNALSQRFAQIGQQAYQQQEQSQSRTATGTAPARQPQRQTAAEAERATLDALYANLDEFGENNGPDLVEKFLKPFKREIFEPLMEMKADYQARRDDLLRKEVALTFKGFNDPELYGTEGSQTAQQFQAVQRVSQLADQILAGASFQGQEMSAGEALDRAHAMLDVDRIAAKERKAITSKIEKRSKGLSARPTGRKTAAAGGGDSSADSRSDRKAMEAYREKAEALGLNVDE